MTGDDFMICKICDQSFDFAKWGEGQCPACGQEYRYDEGYTMVLSDAQLKLLRADHAKEDHETIPPHA